ncbi:MAG: hypothetical protein COV99_07025 [Bacteroidetes bacterium CG12_big_fil_rev_8_21_14_0_65_60_17]|nr:MAG: hypothetical protein COV99_07025 [Bacteroidetes bacterium CG12_big_fil_rev_8_21_14_0_65_60_17]
MSIKDILLQKGWAGTTIDRGETVSHLNPVIRVMTVTMHYWDAAQRALEAGAATAGAVSADDMAQARKVLRMDIGKMCETVFSAGGVAYNGVDLEASDYTFEPDGWAGVRAQEKALGEALAQQVDIQHHMRTRAILAAVAANHEARMTLIRNC